MILASALWSEAESATKRLAHGVERRTKIREDNMGVEKSGLSSLPKPDSPLFVDEDSRSSRRRERVC